MINPKQPRSDARQIHLNPMPKRKRRPRNNKSLRLQNSQINIPPDFTQRQNRPRLQNLQLPLQIRPAIRQLARQRLIVRRRTPRRRRNIRIHQRQPIVPLHRHRPIRKSRIVKRAIQKLSRLIPRKRPPRSVRPMRSRRQPHQHQPRARIAKSRHRLAPINPVPIRPPFFPCHRLAVRHQPRTFPARNNFFIEHVQNFAASGISTTASPPVTSHESPVTYFSAATSSPSTPQTAPRHPASTQTFRAAAIRLPTRRA